jgi:hypothetical protein
MSPVAVTRCEAKSHYNPDEIRHPHKTKVEIVRLEGFTVGRFNMNRAGNGRSVLNLLYILNPVNFRMLDSLFPKP